MNEQDMRNQIAEEIASYVEWMRDHTYLDIPVEELDAWKANWTGTAMAIRRKFIND